MVALDSNLEMLFKIGTVMQSTEKQPGHVRCSEGKAREAQLRLIGPVQRMNNENMGRGIPGWNWQAGEQEEDQRGD